MYMLKIQTLT